MPVIEVDSNIRIQCKFNLIGELFPAGTWHKRLTVAQLEYLAMRQAKTSNRIKLVIEVEEGLERVPICFTLENVYEILKARSALGIESGAYDSKSEFEEKLAHDHLKWCRSPVFNPMKLHPETDGIISRHKLKMREFIGEKWNEKFSKLVRLETKVDGVVTRKECRHLRWTVTIGTIAEKCAQWADIEPHYYIMKVKVNGVQMTPFLEQQIGELCISEDRLHLLVEFYNCLDLENPPDYNLSL